MATIFGMRANHRAIALAFVLALLALSFSTVDAKRNKARKHQANKRGAVQSSDDPVAPLVFSDTVCGGSDGYFCGKGQCCNSNGTCGYDEDACLNNCDGAHGFCSDSLGLTAEVARFIYRLYEHWPALATATQPDPQYVETNIGFGTHPWSSNVDPDACDWYGLSCGEDDDIEFVSFYNVNLGGTIPEFITELEALGVLSFVGTNIGGTLDVLSGFNYIIQIDMSNNRINGTVPTAIISNSQLEAFRLGNNQLSGTIPNAFSTRMTEVNVTRNALSGSMGFVTSAAAWDTVDLSYNTFSGTLPASLSQFGGNTIKLDHNQFSGTIPDLTNCENLMVLDFSYNNLDLCPAATTYLDVGTTCSLGNQGISSCGCSDSVFSAAGCTYDAIPSSCGSGSNGAPVGPHPNVGPPADAPPGEDAAHGPVGAASTISASALVSLAVTVLLALAC